jgi:hypothetical protein
MGRHWVRFETSLQSWVQATGRYNAGARHATSCTRKLAAFIPFTNFGADPVIPIRHALLPLGPRSNVFGLYVVSAPSLAHASPLPAVQGSSELQPQSRYAQTC